MHNHGPCHQLLETLASIHNEAKAIYLLAEELEFDDFLSFIQPVREQRDAHEHVMRAVASSLGHGKCPGDSDYQQACLRSAIGHEIRCFFDSCDWLGVLLRKGIRTRLEPYSHDCIRTVLPDYYADLRPRIDTISAEIAKSREKKDGAELNYVQEDVRAYKALINELESTFTRIVGAAPALEEFTLKEKRSVDDARRTEQSKIISDRKWSFGIKVAGGLVVAAGNRSRPGEQ